METTVKTISELKDVLDYRTAIAFLAIQMIAIVVLFWQLIRAKDAHLKTVMAIIPVADKLASMVAALDLRRPRNTHSLSRENDSP